jgi:hypothetical protein
MTSLKRGVGGARWALVLWAAVGVAACGPTIGDPCTVPGQCNEAVCLNREGTPGGYCTQQCQLDNPKSCPAGSVCVRNAIGPAVSGCMRTCATAEDCREGYACERDVRDTPERICIGPLGL